MTTDTRPIVRLTDDSTKAEYAEALGWLCQAAKREFPKVGSAEMLTPWDRRHAAIDEALTDWERAPA